MPRPSARPTEPKVFTQHPLRYTVAGRGLDPAQVERAVKLSKEKYCSATLMLAKTAEITLRDRARRTATGRPRRCRRRDRGFPMFLSRSRRIRLDVSQRPPPCAWTRA